MVTISSQPIPVSGLSQEFLAPVVESELIKSNLEEKQTPSYVSLHTYVFHIYRSLLDLVQQFHGLTAAPSHLIKGDLFL